MAYIALYRKYRSQSFGQVIGQQHVTTVLQNAIRLGRVAHAYLFCGPRGCGKTSTARLVARALNCQAGDGPTPEPCGVCDMCVRIRDGAAMDVIEMDAASETGIDDVREKIIENAKYAPGEARYKVYIIDEVHDLSLKAFDSLLKTIEEPPAHVVFILATTESHKVPITVRSRCQRMDFRRGAISDLTGNIRRVLDAEAIEYEPEAVTAIAQAAEGSFRDSLSLLEQALAYTEGKLTAEAVHTSVGTVGPVLLDSITQVLASNDMHAAFLKAGELVDSGKDVKQTLVALQAHLRDLMVASIAASPQALADASPERFQQLKSQAKAFTAPALLRMLDILAEAERDVRFTNQHRLLLERAFWSILPANLNGMASAVTVASPAPTAHPAAKPTPTARVEAPAPQASAAVSQPKPVTPAPAPAPTSIAAASQASSQPATPVEEQAPPKFVQGITLDEIRRVWPRVRQGIVQRYKAAGAVFGEEVVQELDGHFIVVAFPNEFSRDRADKPKSRELIEQVVASELHMQGLRVRCTLQNHVAQPAPTADMDEPPPFDFGSEPPPEPHTGGGQSVVAAVPPAPTPAQRTEQAEQEFLNLVMEELNGKLVDE